MTTSDLEALMLIDGVLSTEELSLENALLIRGSGPWGQQFPEPLFVGDFYILSQRVVGKKHIKLVLCLDCDKQEKLSAIAFNVSSDDIEEYKKEKINIVYKVDVNFWQGRESLQLIIETLIY